MEADRIRWNRRYAAEREKGSHRPVAFLEKEIDRILRHDEHPRGEPATTRILFARSD